MSENPLATMKSRPAKVSPFRSVRTKLRQSSKAEPKVVVRQLPPRSGVGIGDHDDVEQGGEDESADDEARDQPADVDIDGAVTHAEANLATCLDGFNLERAIIDYFSGQLAAASSIGTRRLTNPRILCLTRTAASA